jgi:hypothetical protein
VRLNFFGVSQVTSTNWIQLVSFKVLLMFFGYECTWIYVSYWLGSVDKGVDSCKWYSSLRWVGYRWKVLHSSAEYRKGRKSIGVL